MNFIDVKEPPMLTTDDPLLLRQQDARGVITLTLNRPQAFNALSEAMLDALQAELDLIARDPKARLLVINATGKAFCACLLYTSPSPRD